MKLIFEHLIFVLLVTIQTSTSTPEYTLLRRDSLGYHVGLDVIYKDYTKFCGGALISKEHILTAAHCIYKAERVKVKFGLQDFKTEDKIETIDVDKSSIIWHENFVEGNFENNNIAIVKLPSPVTENDYIEIVNLPKQNQVKNSFEKELTMFARWDRIGNDIMLKRTSTMKMVFRNVIDADACTHLYSNFNIEVNICLEGSERERDCLGDSGGPLTINNGDYRTLIGVATFAGEKCEKGSPIVFTRVTSYMDWISSKGGLNLNNQMNLMNLNEI